jgi:hypothetical protein
LREKEKKRKETILEIKITWFSLPFVSRVKIYSKIILEIYLFYILILIS